MKPKNIIIIALIFLVMAIAILVLKAININLGYQIDNMRIEFETLYDQNKKMAVQAAGKAALERVEQFAKTKLNMQRPEKVYYIISSAESSNF